MELLKIVILILLLVTGDILRAEDKILHLPFFQNKKECFVNKDYIYLSKKEASHLEKSLNGEIPSRIIKRYNLKCKNSTGRIYILSEKIRTHFQTLLIEVANSKVVTIETLRFEEPKKYAPPKGWYKHAYIKKSIHDIQIIDGITGATLTSKSNKKLVTLALLLEKF